MPSRPYFSLGDQLAGVFAEICEKNGITSCWLQWKFELAVLNEETSPFIIDTNNDARCGPLKNGVKKVTFTVDFDHDNPNFINYIRFTEVYEGSENKHWIVTQTSINHVHEDGDCKLWLELPPGTRKEDIGAVINLWRVQICCDQWVSFLPANPVTQLEKAHRVVAGDNVEWLKTQLMKRELVVTRMDEELEQKNKEIASLTDDIRALQLQLAGLEVELDQSRLREAGTTAKRKARTPKTRAQQTPNTAPAKSLAQAAPSGPETPSKKRKLSMTKETDDPFVG
ncbi:hypothetical protein VMCG_02385 [Cytospora schulzeri]|uniref:Uncharacterized protein n=1 Tax=Cytospora schulzeri TaxID=448051 RepID=A0A423X193_9PEZI|nr:hypothetical protein VMCG_02385 [Valsa malicola]